MAGRNGSGVFTVSNPDFVSGTVISSSGMDANFADVATAITQSIAVDGQTTITGNIPMATYKFTGLGNGSASTDSAAFGQIATAITASETTTLATIKTGIQDQSYVWCGTAGGTQNALTLTPSPAITAYATGQSFQFKAGSSASNSSVTVAISGLATKAVERNDAALSSSEVIAANKYYEILYDGTAFQLTQLSAGTAPTTQIADGSFTRAMTTASGNQAITGVGFQPTHVEFLSNKSGQPEYCVGFDDGTNARSIWYNAGSNANNDDTNSIYADATLGNIYKGNIGSLDSDGFTVAWVKVASPTGTLSVKYRAFKV